MEIKLGEISRFRTELILLAILFLGAFLRIDDLGKESIWLDESVTVRMASSDSFIHLIENNFKEDPYHAPLYYAFIHYWIKVFGKSEFSVRFPSVVFGLLEILVIYKVGSLIFDKETGLIASLILAVSQFHVQYSQEARMYSLLAFLALFSFYFFIKLMKDTSMKIMVCYIISSTLLMYTHLYGLFIIVAQNIYVFSLLMSSSFDKKFFKKWILLQFVLLVLFVPQGIVDIKLAMGIKGGVYTSAGWLPQPSLDLIISAFRDFIGPYFLFFPFLLLMAFSIIPCENFNSNKVLSHNKKVYLLFLWFLSPIMIPYVASNFFVPMFHVRYSIGASSALYLFVAKGIRDINQKHLKIIVLGLIIGVSLSHVLESKGGVHKQQWRDAVADLESHAEQGDLVLISPGWSQSAFDYYFKRSDLVKIAIDSESMDKSWLTIEDHRRVWVISLDGIWSMDERLRESYSESYTNSHDRVQVYLFEKKAV